MPADYSTAKVLLKLGNRLPLDCFMNGKQAYRLLVEMGIIDINNNRKTASFGFILVKHDFYVGDVKMEQGRTTGPGFLQSLIDHKIKEEKVQI